MSDHETEMARRWAGWAGNLGVTPRRQPKEWKSTKEKKKSPKLKKR